jgi:fucose 4-O-acetylase-like acetyltransferase
MLFLIALIVAIVQVTAASRRRELLRFLPPALGATAVGLLCGLFLALGAEFQWISGALLDDLALPIMIAALAWMFYNRMGSKRNRMPSN